jgi:hypothetical protein
MLSTTPTTAPGLSGRLLTAIPTLWICFVFIQSLFFKFTGSVETAHIFGTLDAWAAGLTGISGLFAPGGIFSAHVVGGSELVASLLLLAGLVLRKPLILAGGAVLALAIISGAIVFHLFTPLGVEVLGDGGLLFAMACTVWICAAFLILRHRQDLLAMLPRR